jgi:Ni/Fe-hydrogenase 1 B-type cytochrome subunit
LTRAWPALCIFTIRRDGTFTRFPSSRPMSTQSTGVRDVFLENGNAPVEYRRVYVWEMPVRAYHWINAIALTLLCITGFLIGHPVHIAYASEAYQQYWFGWVRFVHFAAAYVYVFNFAARIYWGFVGNKYAKWNNFFPITKKQQQEIVDVIKTDVLQVKMHGEISTGHNSLAAFIYFLTFLAFCFQTITGFALYSSMSNAWLPSMFKWIVPLMGGEFSVRFWHHLFMWFFVTFIIVHIYLSFYHDYIEGRGTISSIVGGWKFDRQSPEQLAAACKLVDAKDADKKK